MDFHSLTRKELQSLCKQHRIPANMTNVAMADALQALLAVGEKEGSVQDTLRNQTPKKSLASASAPLRSYSRNSARRPAEAVALASVEPKDQPGSPLPRSRRVTARASEIRRLVSEDDVEEEKKEEVLVENTTMTTTVKRGRRTSKKGNDDIMEGGAVETAKTPVTRNGRRMTARRGAETKAVEQDETDETDDTVVSSRTTTRRTRQSSKAIVVDVTTTANRRGTRARARASVIEIGTLAPAAERVEKDIEVKICADRDGDSSFPSGENTMDWETVDVDAKDGNLVVVEDGTGGPEAEVFADMEELEAVTQEKEYKLARGDIDDKDGNLVVVEDGTGGPEAEVFADMEELEAVTQEKEYKLARGDIDDKYEECQLVEFDAEIPQRQLSTAVEENEIAVVALERLTQENEELVKEESDELAQDEVASPKGKVVNLQLENVAQEKEAEVVSPLAEEIVTVELENEAREKEHEEKGSLDKDEECIDSFPPPTEKTLDLASMDADDNCEQECNLEVNDNKSPQHQLSIQIEEHAIAPKGAEEFAQVELENVALLEGSDEETERGFEIKNSLERGDAVEEEVSDSVEVDISSICSMDLEDRVEERTEGDEDKIVNRKDCDQDSNAAVTNLPQHELILNVKEDGMTRDAPVITEEQEPNKADNEFPGLEGSPVLGLVSSLEKPTILADAGDEQNTELEEMRLLALLSEEDNSTETDISITLNQVSIDAGNEKLDEVIASVVNSGIARSNNVDLHAQILGKIGKFQESPDVIFEMGESEEKSQCVEANKENDIGEVAVENGAEKKSQCCEANKENIGEVTLEKNLPADLHQMSLTKLKKLYKETINNNNNKVERRRLALTEINDNITVG